MMISAGEVLLDVFHCVGYNSLVALCCTNSAFFRLVNANADRLALQSTFSAFCVLPKCGSLDCGELLLYNDANNINRRFSINSWTQQTTTEPRSIIGFHRMRDVILFYADMDFAENSLSLFPQFEYAECFSVAFTQEITEEFAEMLLRFMQQLGRLRKFVLQNRVGGGLVDKFVKMVSTRERPFTIEFLTALPCVAGRTDFALHDANNWSGVYVSSSLRLKLCTSNVWPHESFTNIVTNDPNMPLPLFFTT